MSEDKFVELFVRYPGHPYVALIDGLDEGFELRRDFQAGDHHYHRRDHLPDGSQRQVYRLPITDAIWEIAERIDGRNLRRYVAVREADGCLYRIPRDLVEAVAEGSMQFENAIALCSSLAGETGRERD